MELWTDLSDGTLRKSEAGLQEDRYVYVRKYCLLKRMLMIYTFYLADGCFWIHHDF